MTATHTIQTAMSELLAAMGFEAMAREVLTETETDRLRKYARIIVKNLPADKQMKMANTFRMHNPPLY